MRKEKSVTITDDNRDRGKVFLLTELPASEVEWWATRAFLALARSGVDVPDNVAESGFAGIAALGFKALGGVNAYDAKELMDDMWRCIQIQPDPQKHPEIKRTLVENDIEEVSTRLRLRREVFELHAGFSIAGGVSTTESSQPALADAILSSMPTSRARSVR